MHPRDRREAAGLLPDARTLRIQLLGEFSVSRNGQRVEASAWRFQNSRRLLQILTLEPGHRIHREQLIDLFWPESEYRAANNNLHQVLHHARRALKSIGFDGPALRLEGSVLSLNVSDDMLWIDADRFETAAREAHQGSDPARYLEALDLYAGELLPDERYADWATARRDALQSTYRELLLRLGEIHEARGELPNAEKAFGRLVGDDPVHESGHAGLMRVYARTGRRHQALAQYRQLEELVRRDLDVEPGHEIVDLRDTIREGSYPFQKAVIVPQPARSANELPFVGRERELHVLRDAVERSFSGQGYVLMMCGEPGLGKTRTAHEIADYAERSGSTVLWGNCYQDDGAPAYWPWVQIIRGAIGTLDTGTLRHLMGRGAADIGQIVPEVRERMPDAVAPVNLGAEQARFQLFDSMHRFFKQLALRSPLMLVLDDLHWGDRSTLLLLSFLAREVDRSRMVILGTYRDMDIDAGHPLTSTLAELSRGSACQRLSLSGLNEADIRLLIEASAGKVAPEVTASWVIQRTEGNPFFVGELLRLLREGASRPMTVEEWETAVPQGVRDVISHRLSRLSTSCQDVLAGAAVIGREFGLPVLEHTVAYERGRVLDALDEALQAQLIEFGLADGHFRFTHALVQETVYTGLALASRAALHGRTGAALEQIHAGELERYLAELAYHFARSAVSGDIRPAVEYGMRAGDQALDRIAYSEAIDHYRRTLRLIATHQPSGRAERLDLLLRLGEAHNHIGNRAESKTTFEEAAVLARELDLPEQFGRAALGYAGLGLFLTNEDQRPLLDEAAGWLPDEDSSLRARIHARLAFELYDVAPIEDRAALIERAEAIARRLGDPSTLIYVLIARNWTMQTIENLDERLAISREVLRLVEESGEVMLAAPAQAMHFYDGFHLGDPGIVDRQITVFEELAERLREPQREWLSVIFKLTRAVHLGEYAEADMLEAQARRIAATVLPPHGHDRRVTSQLVEVRREQGRLHEIDLGLSGERANMRSRLYWRALTAHIADHSGSTEQDQSIAALVEALGRSDLTDLDVVSAAALLSTTAEVSTSPDLMATLFGYLAPHCEGHLFARITHQPYGPVSYYSGRLATLLGHHALAVQHLQRAVAMNQRMGARPYLARSQYELAKALRRRATRGDREEAARHLCEAGRLAHDVGMPALLDDIRTESPLFASS